MSSLHQLRKRAIASASPKALLATALLLRAASVQAQSPPPPAVPLPPAPQAAPTIAASEPRAHLDYSDGSFYLRSAGDNLVLVPSARAHIDTYAFNGPGVDDYHRANGTGLKANLLFRRFVIELGGLIRRKWFFWLGGNFAPTQVDANQAPLSTANVYDGMVGYLPSPHFRIYFGQYNAPFTMENVTSSRWLDLMERSLSVRTLATPYNKADGLLFWGDTESKVIEYQVGVFGGDGMNRPNVDNRVDGMARVLVRPFAGVSGAGKRFHLGVGGRAGSRDRKFAQYDTPSMSTPGGYAYWAPSYTGEDGTKIHVLQRGLQVAGSAEFYLPFERFDLRGEVVYINEQRHEVAETVKNVSLRKGKLFGYGAYGQLSIWLAGTPRIGGNPAGFYGVLKLPEDIGAQAPYALQLVLRGEIIRVNYDANSSAGDPGKLSAVTNNIDVNVYQGCVNYWATKHVRLTAEYSMYEFPGGAAHNQAVAPGVRAGTSKDAKRLDEFSFRVGLML